MLEITETSVITDFERSRLVIEQLRDFGVTVSIDDFGAGVTSLAYLSSLPVRRNSSSTGASSLASRAGKASVTWILLRSTIELGHAMGLRIVAEGIEDEETLDLLAALGCDFAQGFCICRPKPAEELALRATTVTSAAAG